MAIAAMVASSFSAGQHSNATPLPSHLEAVTFDANRNRLVLFGGTRQVDGKLWTDSDETWEWDGTRWRAVPSPVDGPGPRRGHALAYDPSHRRVVLVGGVKARPGAPTIDDPLDDTWFYDGHRWSRGPQAPVMFGHLLVHDPRDGAVLLLGFEGREVHASRRLVIWRWTGAAWTRVDGSGPMLAGPVRAAFDARRSVLVVPVVDDVVSRVWEWNGRSWRSTDAPGPVRRSRHSVAFDGASNRVVLIGGRAEPAREMLDDAWWWDGERWTSDGERTEAPPPHASASLVFDPVAKRLLLYGGVSSGRLVADLWVLSARTWTRWRPGPS